MAKILFINANMGKPEMHKDSGGAIRTVALVEALKDHEVTFLSFGWTVTEKTEKVTDNLTYIYAGVDARTVQNKNRTVTSTSKNPDLCVDVLYRQLNSAREKIRTLANQSDLVILEHFSGAPFLNEITDTPIIYSSQNCEIFMANQLFGEDSEAAAITKKMEALALEKADLVTYCSTEDLDHLQEFYGLECDSAYVPNGSDEHFVTKPSIRKRSKSIMFVGSGHPPNIEAASAIIPVARLMPDYTFNLCGSASTGIKIRKELIPSNVNILGKVSDEELEMLFADSFAFINPMKSGSGTHLKMMEALSYGIPIVTSTVGARGFSDKEIKSSMLIAENTEEMILAIESLEDDKKYETIINNSKKVFADGYNWENIKNDFAKLVDDFLENQGTSKKKVIEAPKTISGKKESILIYSIVRNIEPNIDRYYRQIRAIVDSAPEYDFYLSIYENDSTDRTKRLLKAKDWSFFKDISIITEDLNTQLFGSVKDATRVENLAKARNKAIEARDFINNVDYVLMVEGDNKFKTQSVLELLNFKNIEPDFDIVSATSIRPAGTHYDWWATRTTPIFNERRSELDPDYKQKHYGEYYSTSNGICLYRAKPFQEGIRHGWINNVTNEFDCEMVVLCQGFHDAGYHNIYINYRSLSFH